MRIENQKLVLERQPCRSCWGEQTVPTRKVCPVCKGSRRGPRGGRDGCRNCYDGRVYDPTDRVPCTLCTDGTEPETRYSWLPKGELNKLPFGVMRESRSGTWNEEYLGYGFIVSVTDYGRAWNATDEQLLEIVRRQLTEHPTQGTTISDEELNVCPALAVILHYSGFTIGPVWDTVAFDRARAEQMVK